jgi:tripartite-type tricarboxylate transporter receptor subunit TctC
VSLSSLPLAQVPKACETALYGRCYPDRYPEAMITPENPILRQLLRCKKYTANIGSLMALIEAGKVRPVAVTSPQRWGDLPDVPTLGELGIADAVSDTFQGVFAPAGTPQPVIDRLASELTAILHRADIRDKFAKVGLPVTAEGPQAFRARIAREVPMYRGIIEQAGLRIQ